MTHGEWLDIVDGTPEVIREDFSTLGPYVLKLAEAQEGVVRAERGIVYDDMDPSGPPIPPHVQRARARREQRYEAICDVLRHRQTPLLQFTILAQCARVAAGIRG